MKKCCVLYLLSVLALLCGCGSPEKVPEAEISAVQEVVNTKELEIVPLQKTTDWVVRASSEEEGFVPELAVDGTPETRWSSKFNDNEWWLVDFGKEETVETISLVWETAFAREYEVQICGDDEKWRTILDEKSGHPGMTLIKIEPQPVRMMRVICKKRGTQWGNSLMEVLFNDVSTVQAAATASSGGGDFEPANAIDGDMQTRWSSGFGDGEWWQIRFDEPEKIGGVIIHWETAFAEKFDVQLSDDGKEWKTVFSEEEGDGNMDIIFFEPQQASFLRVQGRQRGTGWGYSIWEIELFKDDRLPQVSASSTADASAPVAALDGKRETEWKSNAAGEQWLVVSLPKKMRLGGMEIAWGDLYAEEYTIDVENDGNWSTVYSKSRGNGGTDYDFFDAVNADKVRITCKKPEQQDGYAIREIKFKSGGEAATPLRFYKAAAKDAPEGWYPMWLRRIQEFWTITGVPEDTEELLISETGVVEPRKGGFCVQPFIATDDKLVTWSGVETRQTLQDEILPLPTTEWITPKLDMDVSAVTYGEPQKSVSLVRYRVINKTDKPFAGRLALAVRPFQLNPTWQRGGMSSIRDAKCTTNSSPEKCIVDGRDAIVCLTAPHAMGAAPASKGDAVDFIVQGKVPPSTGAKEPDGMVSIALDYSLNIAAGGTQDVVVAYPMHNEYAALPADAMQAPSVWFDEIWAQEQAMWSGLLNRFSIDIADQNIINMMKSYIAYILLNKDGPWIKPGPRNYNHAWIRDGAMTSVSLLRMGIYEPVKRYVQAYSKLVTDDGWAPFIILEGGNPVAFNDHGHEGQEYDSQGQYPFLIRQYYDFTGDEELVRECYPNVIKTLDFAARLRRQRMTDEYKSDPEKIPYYGILPESNSHEGYYPAKHSYWDDYWYLRGLKDGVYLADTLGYPQDAARLRKEEAAFREDLQNSIMAVIRRDNLNTIPGCVELGDFDSTSTAIAITACEQNDLLPEPYKSNTFNFYYNGFKERLKPDVDHTFTPYEVRTADAFVRIGDPEKARTMLQYFTEDSSLPQGWNHLAEVVHARKRSPSYIGDMPHTWVGSGYIGAVRTIFAYEYNGALVLAAGVADAWLSGTGVSVQSLPTQYGDVSYKYKRSKDGKSIEFHAEGEAKPPKGFVLYVPDAYTVKDVTSSEQDIRVKDGSIHFKSLPVDVVITIESVNSKKKRVETMTETAIPEQKKWKLTSSGDESAKYAVANAADGRMDTRWSSPASDPQWIKIDLGSSVTVAGIILHWETAFSSSYEISVSENGNEWKMVYKTETGDGGLDDINFTPVDARFIKIDCLKRGTGWGHSLFDIEVKGLSRQWRIDAATGESGDTLNMMDGTLDTVWQSAAEEKVPLTIDLREMREFGGVRIDWGDNYAQKIEMQISEDGKQWKKVVEQDEGIGQFDLLMHGREKGRYIRLVFSDPKKTDHGIQIRQLMLRGPDEVLTPLATYELAALKAPAGWYPEQLKTRQVYWTVCGLPGDDQESLFDEYGNLEPVACGPTIMPYILPDGGALITALDGSTDQSLEQNYMPMPKVVWGNDKGLQLGVEAFAAGGEKDAFTTVLYTLQNTSDQVQKGKMLLVVRPVQTNPKWQHGGLSPIEELSAVVSNGMTSLSVNERLTAVFTEPMDGFSTASFKNGDIIKWIAENDFGKNNTNDPNHLLSGVVVFDYELVPGAQREWVMTAPLHENHQAMNSFLDKAGTDAGKTFADYNRQMQEFWKSKVERVGFELGDKRISDTVKSQIAYILINQDGLAIQPGSRNYNRSWIRDGSITASAMMKMGLMEEAEDYLDWYSASIQSNGLVPPILNNDGSVNEGWGSNLEYDSQGQYIYAIMEYYRYTGSRDFLARHYDSVKKAMRFMQELRERTLVPGYMKEEKDHERFRGILPPSISHEGYQEPAHSYWDDFWALRGWQDGIEAARIMQDTQTVSWAEGQYKEFEDSIAASIQSTIESFDIDYVPSSADFGDPDANSIAIAIYPCAQAQVLPEEELRNTFEQYMSDVEARGREGASYRYTPYEVRNIMAMATLGKEEQAWKLHDILFEDRRPAGWNHFAEVVISEPRIGTYIGDMPHTWVGSGYANSIRSMVIKENGDQLMLLPATPAQWMENDGIHLKNLPTYFGPVTMDAVWKGNRLEVDLTDCPDVPGGIVLCWPEKRQPESVDVDGKPFGRYDVKGLYVPKGAKKIVVVWKKETPQMRKQAQLIEWMKVNQDTSSAEKQLLADSLGLNVSQTFNNSLAALAFTCVGERERAARILEYYQQAMNPKNANPKLQRFYVNGEARGFFQNAFIRSEDGEEKDHVCPGSDRWMGDMCWLCMACLQFEKRFVSDRFANLKNGLLELLNSWYIPQATGGYIGSGWRDEDDHLHEENGHHEGNIDAYAVMMMAGQPERAADIEAWLMLTFDGPEKDRLPFDLYTWRVQAFAPRFAKALDIVENTPGFKKNLQFNGKDITGFTAFRTDDQNIWCDGLGHIACAYAAINNAEKSDFYTDQLGLAVIDDEYLGNVYKGIPYTLRNTPGYEWVNINKGFLSCAAWYVMASEHFNPMQLF